MVKECGRVNGCGGETRPGVSLLFLRRVFSKHLLSFKKKKKKKKKKKDNTNKLKNPKWSDTWTPRVIHTLPVSHGSLDSPLLVLSAHNQEGMGDHSGVAKEEKRQRSWWMVSLNRGRE